MRVVQRQREVGDLGRLARVPVGSRQVVRVREGGVRRVSSRADVIEVPRRSTLGARVRGRGGEGARGARGAAHARKTMSFPLNACRSCARRRWRCSSSLSLATRRSMAACSAGSGASCDVASVTAYASSASFLRRSPKASRRFAAASCSGAGEEGGGAGQVSRGAVGRSGGRGQGGGGESAGGGCTTHLLDELGADALGVLEQHQHGALGVADVGAARHGLDRADPRADLPAAALQPLQLEGGALHARLPRHELLRAAKGGDRGEFGGVLWKKRGN